MDTTAPRRFDIALSFPGEPHRPYVAEVAAQLAKEFGEDRILYDKYHDAEFARSDLITYLPELYRTESELIVIFLCQEYPTKSWCKREWRHINQLIDTADADRIMFLSFGNPGDLSSIGILSGDGYIDLSELPAQTAAEKIIKRLGINQGNKPVPKPAAIIHCATIPNDISRIDKYAPEKLIGRESETKLLNHAWLSAVNNESKRPHVLTFVALGGEGKTSLVAKWAAGLAHDNWLGCEAVFAWSFYSQGTQDQSAASSDLFLKEALEFFGDKAMADSAQHASEKGKRLAQLVGAKRALLILDGVEPLQYAPTSSMKGELKDYGLSALLKGLASHSLGLCVVTTRYSIPDLNAYRETTAPEKKLLRLSREAGVGLLQAFGVKGSLNKNIKNADGKEYLNEYEKLVEDVQGHALTLNLLGSYLHEAYAGDIRKRDLIKLEEADEVQGGHAFRVMDAYVRWFERDSGNVEENRKAQRALAVLRLMGLFDRPVSADCFTALLKAPSIPNLTELLVEKNEAKRNVALTRLENAKLLMVNRDTAGTLLSLDGHPLVREYFAKRLCEQQPDAFRAAHRRLYKHLCATTKEGEQPTLAELQPLYQAVVHGCLAGMYEEARAKVYSDRIQRGAEAYSAKKLGAFGFDLGVIACFFEQAWSRVSPAFSPVEQAWLLNEATFRLLALGRLAEAEGAMRVAMEINVNESLWKGASACASNLSALELTLGDVAGVVKTGAQSVSYADQSGDVFLRMVMRAAQADALHLYGQRAEADALFKQAEQMQAECQPSFPLLYSLQGFCYCDLLLATAERAAWRAFLPSPAPLPMPSPRGGGSLNGAGGEGSNNEVSNDELPHTLLRAVSARAAQTLQWVEQNNLSLLDIALNHLTLGRAALYVALLEGASSAACQEYIQKAVDGLRRAGSMDHIPRGLLTRAWLGRVGRLHLPTQSDFRVGTDTCPPYDHSAGAKADLDEALEIAERGPMPLHMADIYLHRARLFCRESAYPWQDPDGTPRSAQQDLAEARRLIEKHGYWRRKEELEDAELVIGRLA